jgi:hypothetical protein
MSKPYLRIIRINPAVTTRPSLEVTKRALTTRRIASESIRSLKKLGTLDYSLSQANAFLIAGAKTAKIAARGNVQAIRPEYELRYSRKGIRVTARGHRNPQLVRALRSRIKEARNLRRALYLDARWIDDTQVMKAAGTFTKPGTIFELLQKRRSQAVFKSKRPESDQFHVGVEIEFCSPESSAEIGPALVNAGLAKNVQLKQDGSVHAKSGHHGHEIAIVAPVSEIAGVVMAVSNLLRAGGAYVNKTCGLHVHLDQRGRERHDVERSFQNLVACQKILFDMLPASRRDNTYCRRNMVRTFSKAATGDRYHAINATAYYKYKTLEVRMHSSTIDAKKILNWIDLLKAIHDAPAIGRVQTLRGLAKQVGLSSGLESYARARIEQFSSVESNEDSDAAESGAA